MGNASRRTVGAEFLENPLKTCRRKLLTDVLAKGAKCKQDLRRSTVADTNDVHDMNPTQHIADAPRGPYYADILLPECDPTPGGVAWQRVGTAVMDLEHRAVTDRAGLHYLQRYDGSKLSEVLPKYYEFPGRPVGPCVDMAWFFSTFMPMIKNLMARGDRNHVSQSSQPESVLPQVTAAPKTPRVLPALERQVRFSVPAPGRPAVPWVRGVDESMIREYWSTQESPFGENAGLQTLALTKKLVVYQQAQPGLRLVLLLGDVFERKGERWQPIMQTRVERDRGIDPKLSRPLEERLWEEVCRVERRGRPCGTGRPKHQRKYPIAPADIGRLRKEGLNDKDLRVLFGVVQDMTCKQIGLELGVSGQAAWKRWNSRVLPALRRINPKFSIGSLKLAASGLE
jgi:hypothetical protein